MDACVWRSVAMRSVKLVGASHVADGRTLSFDDALAATDDDDDDDRSPIDR